MLLPPRGVSWVKQSVTNYGGYGVVVAQKPVTFLGPERNRLSAPFHVPVVQRKGRSFPKLKMWVRLPSGTPFQWKINGKSCWTVC